MWIIHVFCLHILNFVDRTHVLHNGLISTKRLCLRYAKLSKGRLLVKINGICYH